MSSDVVLISHPGDAHGDAVERAIVMLGAHPRRLSFQTLREQCVDWTADGARCIGDIDVASRDVVVWWRRPGIPDTDDLNDLETALAIDEVPHIVLGVLDSGAARWVDDPRAVDRAELKLVQLDAAARLHITVPFTLVTNDPSAARAFASKRRVVAKALSPGVGIVPFVDTIEIGDFDLVATLPTMLQVVVEALADLRVVVVGHDAFVWRRVRAADVLDWRRADPGGDDFQYIGLAHPVAAPAIAITDALGLTCSVQDWLETTDRDVFLEANPVGQWLFLRDAEELIAPRIARHLLVA